jgi:protein SCO1/2
MNINSMTVIASIAMLPFISCQKDEPRELPIIGFHDVVDGDTVYHHIPAFRFVNQDSQWVTNQTFSDKIYVADFFFTSCPTICPKLTKSMLQLYEQYEEESRLRFLSHSIDTKRDTVGKLALYAGNLGVSSDRWHFVTGDRSEIFDIADSYYSIAKESPDAPGGFDHSGRLILIDTKGRVRSFCDGTDPEDVKRFSEDIKILLGEVN